MKTKDILDKGSKAFVVPRSARSSAYVRNETPNLFRINSIIELNKLIRRIIPLATTIIVFGLNLFLRYPKKTRGTKKITVE
jgi:hypothetical protein